VVLDAAGRSLTVAEIEDHLAKAFRAQGCPTRVDPQRAPRRIIERVDLGKLAPISWQRMIRAVERVRERLMRATAALERARIQYAVIGGNAVAAWVSRVDEAAVRNTRDVDLLLRRGDLEAASAALVEAGFHRRHVAGLEVFLDGPDGKVRDGVHVVFAGERVRPGYSESAPDVVEAEPTETFRLLRLEPLVRMKLTSFRDKDRMHLRDLLDVGLVDSSWCERLPAPLATRLRRLVDDPEG
jgi:hypothetical protein